MENKAIEWIVLSKAPIPGLVKTRLIPELGEHNACDIYGQLLTRLENTLRELSTTKKNHIALWIAGDCEHEAFRSWADIATVYKQPAQDDLSSIDLGDIDLGVRMAIAVKSALSRGRIPILVGVDVPNLDTPYLSDCLLQLESHDLVISPAEDGGYGLLGMKQFYTELFENKLWGTDSVFAETKRDIQRLEILAKYLPQVWDVDEPEDVARWLTERSNTI